MIKKPTYEELEQRVTELEKKVDAHKQDKEIQKQAEERLRVSEEKFRNVVENLPLGIHLYQSGPDGRLLFSGANPAADKILGLDHTKYLGKTIDDAFVNISKTEIPERDL